MKSESLPTAEVSRPGPALVSLVKRNGRELLLLGLLAGLGVYFAARSPQFFTPDNFEDLARHFGETGLMALPQTFVILTAGIDLSMGALLGLSSVALGLVFQHTHVPFATACAAAVTVGALGGSVNGLAISRLRMPPLVVTLATLAIYHGLAVGLMGNQQTISGFPEGSDWLGQGSFGPVPHQFVLWLVLTLAAGLALYRTPFGRYIYAIGGNETATRLAGVPVDRMRFTIYLLAGLASGLAAVVYVSRLGSSTPDAGGDMTLDVISAIVLGGTDVAGGDGGIAGSVLGILILTVLRNGMDLLDYPAERQTLVVGLLLIATIALDRLVRRRARA